MSSIVITEERFDELGGLVRSALLVPLHKGSIIGKTVDEIVKELGNDYAGIAEMLTDKVEDLGWNQKPIKVHSEDAYGWIEKLSKSDLISLITDIINAGTTEKITETLEQWYITIVEEDKNNG